MAVAPVTAAMAARVRLFIRFLLKLWGDQLTTI